MTADADNAALQAQVSRSSFYTAMRIMPKAEREAMFAIYKFCRLVDDIADDGTRARPQRAAELDVWRTDLAALYDGHPGGRAAFLAQHVHAFGLRQVDFLAVIDGMGMDVAADIRAPDLATLDLYCDRVAAAVGRLSTCIFGMEEKPGVELAHELGRALQLTNILRDLDEDEARDRLYLPREFLLQAGITATVPGEVLGHANLGQACDALANMAEQRFIDARSSMARCPRRPMRPARAMGAVYRAQLVRLRRRGWVNRSEAVKLAKPMKLWLALRHGLL